MHRSTHCTRKGYHGEAYMMAYPGSNTYPGQLSAQPTTNDEVSKQVRQRGRDRLFKMGVIQSGLGGAAVLIGILSLSYGVPTGSFPFFLGAPLWCGVLALGAGLMGLQGSRERDTDDGSATGRQRCFVMGHYMFTLFSMIISVVMPVFGGLGVFYCLNPGSVITSGGRGKPITTTVIYCEPNHDANLALSGISLALGVLICVLSLPFTIFFCCYATTFGFTNQRQQQREMMRMQAQINNLEQQLASKNQQPY